MSSTAGKITSRNSCRLGSSSLLIGSSGRHVQQLWGIRRSLIPKTVSEFIDPGVGAIWPSQKKRETSTLNQFECLRVL